MKPYVIDDLIINMYRDNTQIGQISDKLNWLMDQKISTVIQNQGFLDVNYAREELEFAQEFWINQSLNVPTPEIAEEVMRQLETGEATIEDILTEEVPVVAEVEAVETEVTKNIEILPEVEVAAQETDLVEEVIAPVDDAPIQAEGSVEEPTAQEVVPTEEIASEEIAPTEERPIEEVAPVVETIDTAVETEIAAI